MGVVRTVCLWQEKRGAARGWVVEEKGPSTRKARVGDKELEAMRATMIVSCLSAFSPAMCDANLQFSLFERPSSAPLSLDASLYHLFYRAKQRITCSSPISIPSTSNDKAEDAIIIFHMSYEHFSESRSLSQTWFTLAVQRRAPTT